MKDGYAGSLCAAALAVTFCLAAAGPAHAQLSQNAVGYERIDIPAGGLALARMDFQSIGGAPAVVSNSVFFATNMTNRAALYIFDNAANRYILERKTSTGWSPGTSELRRGVGFWLNTEASRVQTNNSLYLFGEVPTARTTSVAIARGLNLVGYPYPVDIAWNSTRLATNRGPGQVAYLFNVSNQAYTVVRTTSTGWTANPVIHPGEGFWYYSAKALTWTEAKTYTWP